MVNINSLPWISLTDDFEVHDRIIKNLITKTPVILEAGVCSGNDTLKFKELWPDCTIYGFEPVPDSFETVTRRVKEKNLKNVFITNKALSNKEETLKFFRSSKIPGASSFLKDNLLNLPENIKSQFKNPKEELNYLDEEIIVQTTTADEFFKDKSLKPNYVWLDAEGYELNILKGALSILQNVKVLLSEVNFQEFRVGMTLFKDLYEFMIQNGFTLNCIWGNPQWQGNAVFVK